MNDDSRLSVSRRTLATGAAWAAPAMMMGVTAPAVSASGLTITCPSASGMSLQGGSVMSMTARGPGDGTYAGGTYYALNLGQWNVPAAKASDGTNITGYYLLLGTCGVKTCDATYLPGTEIKVTNGNNVAYKGKVTLQTPVACSPQVAGAGLAESLGIQTSIPSYGTNPLTESDSCQVFSNAALSGALGCLSIPVTIAYLNGLTPVYTSSGGTCCIYLNLCFDTTGCISTEGVKSYSFTSTPLY